MRVRGRIKKKIETYFIIEMNPSQRAWRSSHKPFNIKNFAGGVNEHNTQVVTLSPKCTFLKHSLSAKGYCPSKDKGGQGAGFHCILLRANNGPWIWCYNSQYI